MTRHRRLLLLLIPFALFGIRCNSAECEAKRDELWALKDSWTRCEEDWECVKVFGNTGDCSGVLSCDFAANRSSRLDAMRRIAQVAEETTDCLQCQTPNCVSGVLTLCEPVSQRCILVTEIRDGGSVDTPATGGTGTGGTDTGGTSGAGGGNGSGAAAGGG
jgi:hypothetical protein